MVHLLVASPDMTSDAQPVSAFIGLGANTGQRIEQLQEAVGRLHTHPALSVAAASPVYETQAHTLDPDETQPPYLNAVVQVRATLEAEVLFDVCERLERAAGRDPEHPRWAPRPLDLDLLWYDRETRQSERLTLPHPRLAERRFVLRPWADLAPNLYVPAPFEATVAELLEHCPDASVPTLTDYQLQSPPETN